MNEKNSKRRYTVPFIIIVIVDCFAGQGNRAEQDL